MCVEINSGVGPLSLSSQINPVTRKCVTYVVGIRPTSFFMEAIDLVPQSADADPCPTRLTSTQGPPVIISAGTFRDTGARRQRRKNKIARCLIVRRVACYFENIFSQSAYRCQAKRCDGLSPSAIHHALIRQLLQHRFGSKKIIIAGGPGFTDCRSNFKVCGLDERHWLGSRRIRKNLMKSRSTSCSC